MKRMPYTIVKNKITSLQGNSRGVSGYILPLSWVAAMIILTSIGLWYQKVTIQSFLAQRLIEQRGVFLECESLVPFLTDELKKLDQSQLIKEEKGFMQIKRPDNGLWIIDRSKWMNNKVQFTFRLEKEAVQKIALTISFKGND